MTRNVNKTRRRAVKEQGSDGAGQTPVVPLDQETLLRVAEEVRAAFPHPPDAAELVLIDVDPRHLHAFWDVPPGDAARARAAIDADGDGDGDGEQAPLVLRLVAIDADDAPCGQPFDIEVVGLHGQFYVDIWDLPRHYQATLGLRRPDGGLQPLAPTVTADLPALGPAEDRTWREIALPPPPQATIAPASPPSPVPPSPAPQPPAAPPAQPTRVLAAAAAPAPAAATQPSPPPIAPALVTPPPSPAAGAAAAAEAPPPPPTLPTMLPPPPPWAEPAAIEHAAAAGLPLAPPLSAHPADHAGLVAAAGQPAAAGDARLGHRGVAADAAVATPAPPLPPPVAIPAAAAPAEATPAAAAGDGDGPPRERWRPLLEPFPLPPETPADFLPDGLTSHWPFPADDGGPPPAAGDPAAAPAAAAEAGPEAGGADAATAAPGPSALPLESVLTVSSFVHGESTVDFEINAELHIFGRARPGSTLSLYGRPVSVRPDGTFSVTRPLPNGALVLSLLVGRDGRGPDDQG